MTRAAIPLLAVVLAAVLAPADGPKTGLKNEAFDKDPGWEGVNNRIPAKPRLVVQDFGYSPTTHAGKAKGEMGGKITRAATPAYYGAKVGKTLDDTLSASGTFAFTHTSPGSAKGTRALAPNGPVLVPGKVYEWSLVYDPTAGGGKGSITVTLGKESVTLPLKPGWKAEGATFDRFGLFNSNIGGQLVRIYLDDLTYTAGRK